MRTHLLVLALIAFQLTARAETPFTLSIVPSRSTNAERSISTAARHPGIFYLILTNVSDQTQNIWQLSNSWGYRSISFEFNLPNGKTIVISQTHQTFTRNIPSTFFIPPHESQVFPIELDSKWGNLPTFQTSGTIPFGVKAIFEIAPSTEAKAQSVWVGRIESNPYSLNLKHW